MTHLRSPLAVLCLALALGALGLVACAGPNLEAYDWDQLSDTPRFKIGPDDVLKVEFWNQKELSQEVTVRPDGYIDLPLVGELEVGGMTPDQARAALTERMREFEKNPVITVSLKEIKSYRVFITGKVKSPGLYQPTQKVTVLQALSLAGGLTPFANEDAVIIVRRTVGGEEHIPFVYSKVVDGTFPKMNIVLASGDTIVVP